MSPLLSRHNTAISRSQRDRQVIDWSCVCVKLNREKGVNIYLGDEVRKGAKGGWGLAHTGMKYCVLCFKGVL